MNASDIAKKIDELSLDEMLKAGADATGNDIPKVGGDCDTIKGWAKRMGVHYESKAFRYVLDELRRGGHIEDRVALVPQGPHWRRCPVLHCPVLAKKVAEKAGA